MAQNPCSDNCKRHCDKKIICLFGMRPFLRICCLLLLTTWQLTAHAQSFLKRVAIADDPSLKIQCLAKSKQGVIFAGTNKGVFQFDGLVFRKISFGDSADNHDVTALAFSPNNQFWCGLKNGQVFLLQQQQFNLFSAMGLVQQKSITSMVADKLGNLWLGTSGNGLLCFDGKNVTTITVDQGLNDNYIYDLCLGDFNEQQAVVVASDQGLNSCQMVNGKVKVATLPGNELLPDKIVQSVKCIGKGNVVVGMQEKGLAILQTGSLPVLQQVAGLSDREITDIVTWKDQQIFAASKENGLCQYFFGEQKLSGGDSLAANSTQLLTDNEMNLWSASGNSIYLFNQIKLRALHTFQATQKVHAIFHDGERHLLVNEGADLLIFEKQATGLRLVRKVVLASHIGGAVVTSIYKAANSATVWVGTMGKGVLLIDVQTGSVRKMPEPALVSNGNILSITGKEQRVWLALLEGAIQLYEQNGSWKSRSYTNLEKVGGTNYVYQCFEDSKGRVWFATDGKGIIRLSGEELTKFDETKGLAKPFVYAITEDKQGVLWMSTSNGGAYYFDGNQFHRYGEQQGLKTIVLSSTVFDGVQNIGLLTDKGLCLIDPQSKSNYHVGAAAGISFMNQNLNCLATDGDGCFFFVANNKLYQYSDNKQPQLFQPQVMIERISESLSLVDSSQKDFSYSRNNFSFDFNGIYYSDPEAINYQYFLEGYSKEWQSTKDKTVNFFQLPPGKYVFKVRASVNNNFDNSQLAVYAFNISQPYWKQWWFVLLSLLLLGALASWFISLRDKRKAELQKLENQSLRAHFETLKSQVNPHFLFNSFNTLIGLIEDDKDKAVSYVEQLSDFFRSIVNLREKDLITLQEEIELINRYIYIQQQRFGNNLVLTIDLSDIEDYMIPPLTLQLLAENAVKHNVISKANQLTIRIFQENNRLIVSNNINKKTVHEPSTGTGLANVQNRYKIISNESILIQHTEKEFIVSLPLISKA
jgi:ligand-binding sensor domain-containing protein